MMRRSSSGSEPPRLRYWRNRENRKVRKARIARNLLQLSSAVALNLLLAAALLYVGMQAIKHLSGSNEFCIERIELKGVERASYDALREALAPWIGRSLLEMDLERIDALVRQDPWVLRTSVKRMLPATLSVAVVEREPAAMALIDGRVYLVDGSGFVIGPAGRGMSDDLPVLTGLEGLDEAGAAAALARGTALLARLRDRAVEFTSGISEIDLSSSAKITVRTVDPGPEILLDPDLVERNVLKYLELCPQIEREAKLAEYVDLRWSGRISVMPASRTHHGEGR